MHRFGDERIAEWLQEHGYHPRSNKHGGAACQFFLEDLLETSDRIREAARNGELAYQEDVRVGSGALSWNVDLLAGPPEGSPDATPEVPDQPPKIARAPLDEIWLAIDHKSVMTEHGKARRNRQRDLNSFADIMHYHHPQAVSGGILLLNMAERFKSPLRDEHDITEHKHVVDLVEETLDLFREIDRAEGEVSSNIDAIGVVVVEHTNLDDDHETRLVTDSPAPQVDDIVHYETFLDVIVETIEERFL